MAKKNKDYKEAWVGMPEFIQEEDKEFSKIIFRFRNEDDLNEFSELVGQKFTPKTKSAWYPKLEKKERRRWQNES